MDIFKPKGGVNWRLAPWDKQMLERQQCLLMQNFRYKNEFCESIPGTKKYHGTALGTDPVTAIMPYYNDQNDDYSLLAASGGSIYKRNEGTGDFAEIFSGVTKNSIFSSAIRHGILYIPSTKDGLRKYSGGQIEVVGNGDTIAPAFRVIVYAKEVDRLFGISDDAIFGQITWCDLSQPEIWDPANVERIKLKDGERVETGDMLYGKLVIFCTSSIWIYYVSGNEENWKLEAAPTIIGCVAPNTVKKVGSEFWYLGESPRNVLGVYAFNGSTSRLLTDDMTPFFRLANKNKLRNACAELVDDVYKISLAVNMDGSGEKNNYTLDLDLTNFKEDNTPAIYGPHPIGFYSATVLNNRQKSKEFLMGDESDGFVYVEGGMTLKGVNNDDGSLLQNRFVSAIHNDNEWDVMKRYPAVNVFFRPRAYFQPRLKIYVSYGTYSQDRSFVPSVQSSGLAGDYDVFEKRIYGTPQLYQHKELLGLKARGTSIQVEILNDVLAERMAFDGYSYEAKKLYTNIKAQHYAN